MDEVILSRIRKEAYEQGYADGKVDGYNLAGKAISSPRKKGHWVGIDDEPCEVWECDVCGCVCEDWTGKPTYNFCPNCGADMRGEEDGDDNT